MIAEVFRLNGALIKSGDHLVNSLDLTSARWQIIGSLAMAKNLLENLRSRCLTLDLTSMENDRGK